MRLTLPTLDELRRRRAAINATATRKLIPRLLAASVAQVALVAFMLFDPVALVPRNLTIPVLVVVMVLSSAVALWLVMFWRPRLSAQLAAEDALLCHRCGAPLVLDLARERAAVTKTRGAPTPQQLLQEGRCGKCEAPVVAELQDTVTATRVG